MGRINTIHHALMRLGFGSPWLKDGGRYGRRFTQPGRYLLMCSLHSAFMSQVITVKR